MDCGNYVAFHKWLRIYRYRFQFQTKYSGRLTVLVRSILLSPIFFREILSDLLRTGRPSRALYRPTDPHARVDASHAVSTIRQVIADGLASRALSKVLRDCFRWRAETVTLYRDGPLDFLFTTASGCPAFGGLVRHETTIRTPVGTKPKVYYSVHT